MKENANKIVLTVTAILALLMIALIVSAGSCSHVGNGGVAFGNAAAAPPNGKVVMKRASATAETKETTRIVANATGNASGQTVPNATSGGAAGQASPNARGNNTSGGATGNASGQTAPNATGGSASGGTTGQASPNASGGATGNASSQAAPNASSSTAGNEKDSSAAASSSSAASSSASAPMEIDANSDVAMSLVFDVSGSMNEASALSGMSKLESAKKQSSDFVSSVSGQKGADVGLSVRVGVCSFSNTAQKNCDLSSDPSAINASINALKANGQTNMFAGLGEGIDQLLGESGPRLMVLLSDGLSNVGGSRSDILSLADQAAAENIKIYTIGFGPSSSLDEDLLREIASITGGSYSHEDSSDISSAAVGLFATMMNARLSATSQVLQSFVGSVQQGATDQAGSFDITKNGTVQVYLYWPGSVLDMQLIDPDGNRVADGYAGFTIDTSIIPTSITIQNAKQGTWSMEVYGREVSMASEPYYAVAAFSETRASTPAAGGGGSTNNGEGLIFLVIAIAVGCIVGVFAYTKRRSSHEMH